MPQPAERVQAVALVLSGAGVADEGVERMPVEGGLGRALGSLDGTERARDPGDLRCVPIRGNANTRLAKVGGLWSARRGCPSRGRVGQDRVCGRHQPGVRDRPDGSGAGPENSRHGMPGREAGGRGAVEDDERPRDCGGGHRGAQPAQALGVGYNAPVGAYAAGAGQPRMQAAVISGDGRRGLRAHGAAPADAAWRLGRDLAAELLPVTELIARRRAGGGEFGLPASAVSATGGVVRHRRGFSRGDHGTRPSRYGIQARDVWFVMAGPGGCHRDW